MKLTTFGRETRQIDDFWRRGWRLLKVFLLRGQEDHEDPKKIRRALCPGRVRSSLYPWSRLPFWILLLFKDNEHPWGHWMQKCAPRPLTARSLPEATKPSNLQTNPQGGWLNLPLPPTPLKLPASKNLSHGTILKVRAGRGGGSETIHPPPFSATIRRQIVGVDFSLAAQNCERVPKTRVSRFLAFYPFIPALQALPYI